MINTNAIQPTQIFKNQEELVIKNIKLALESNVPFNHTMVQRFMYNRNFKNKTFKNFSYITDENDHEIIKISGAFYPEVIEKITSNPIISDWKINLRKNLKEDLILELNLWR